MPRTPIAPGAVHVWEADLRDVPTAATALLSDSERARADAILAPAPRRLWPSSRALLRLLLARYSGCPPEQLELRRGAHGKPQLARGGVLFNLSHSGALALYAFSAEHAVGVDVEQRGRRPDAFLRSWTRREAAVKCLGTGLAAGSQARAANPGAEPAVEPWLCELALSRSALAALACRSEPAAVERFVWQP